ncbi:hypothetical protein ABZP36_028323 [Zizania latifolia]
MADGEVNTRALVRSLGTEQLLEAISFAANDLALRDIPLEDLWRLCDEREGLRGAKNPPAMGEISGSSASEEVARKRSGDDGEMILDGWKELVCSLGAEQLVNAIYVAIGELVARHTIPDETWRRICAGAAAYRSDAEPICQAGTGVDGAKNPSMGDDGSAGEQVARIKSKLMGGEDGLPGSDSEEAALELLRALRTVSMTFETLEATKIGRTICCLRKHTSEKVRDLATALYREWKALADEHLIKCSSSSSSKPPTPAKTVRPLAADAKANTAAARKPEPPTPKKTACKRKEAPVVLDRDEAKLAVARKNLKERYMEAETTKKQRTIQVIDGPGKTKRRPVVVERRRVVRDCAPVPSSPGKCRAS